MGGHSHAYLLRSEGDPNAQPEGGESDHVGENLRASVHPDRAGEGEEAHGEGAEGEEDQEGQAHEDAVGDDGVVDESALGAGGEGWVDGLVGWMIGSGKHVNLPSPSRQARMESFIAAAVLLNCCDGPQVVMSVWRVLEYSCTNDVG